MNRGMASYSRYICVFILADAYLNFVLPHLIACLPYINTTVSVVSQSS